MLTNLARTYQWQKINSRIKTFFYDDDSRFFEKVPFLRAKKCARVNGVSFFLFPARLIPCSTLEMAPRLEGKDVHGTVQKRFYIFRVLWK